MAARGRICNRGIIDGRARESLTVRPEEARNNLSLGSMPCLPIVLTGLPQILATVAVCRQKRGGGDEVRGVLPVLLKLNCLEASQRSIILLCNLGIPNWRELDSV